MTGRWLGFEDATLTVDPNAGTFRADLRIASRGPTAFNGRFLVGEGLVLTAIAVAA
jgi:4'-phosphopantetheinyl transferase EntD